VHLDDTIVAIATPAGRGGIGVVRIAGPEAKQIAATMLRLPHALEPGRALFGELIEPETGERIDEVVATTARLSYYGTLLSWRWRGARDWPNPESSRCELS